jgi:hypothetical protein
MFPNDCRVRPAEGLAHPFFDDLKTGELLVWVLGFKGPQDAHALDLLEAELQSWSKTAGRKDTSDAVHAEEPFLTRTSLRLRFHNLQHPREAARRLLERFGRTGVKLAESWVVRLQPVAGQDRWTTARLPGMPDERVGFPDPETYRAAVFSELDPVPASEYVAQVSGAIRTKSGDIAVEERAAPLWLPPLRLSYGVIQGPFTPPDARAAEIAKALRTALDGAFAGLGTPPRFFNHLGQFGGVDRVVLPERVGYGWALPSADLLNRYSDGYFRFREQELFEAVRDAVQSLGLSPVVTWQRFGPTLVDMLRQVDSHVLQLWEKP